jgi:hypothetical protein
MGGEEVGINTSIESYWQCEGVKGMMGDGRFTLGGCGAMGPYETTQNYGLT